MNTISTDFKFFLEYDSNPFFIFSSNGKILYLNMSAEMLMGSVTKDELFELAINYAPKSFGFKKTLIELSFGYYEFYSINVLYNSDEEIGLHLYNRPITKVNSLLNLDGYSKTDINLLFEANIELFKMQYNGKLKLITDYELPYFQIHQNNFSFLIRKIFEQLKNSKEINITIKIKIGEMIIVNNKKYPIILFDFEGDNREKKYDKEILNFATENYINAHFHNNKILLEIPAIL